MPTQPSKAEVVPYNDYAIAKVDTRDLMEILEENVGGQITEFDLQRGKVPTGGMTAWVLPSLDGEDEIAKSIDGVIVYHREPRVFWRQSLDVIGGGQPPDCSSTDGKIGVGDPGGECAVCPYAQWGSKPTADGTGRGQACKQIKLVFLLRPDSLLPMALFLPPTSIRPVRQYLLGLASEGQHYSSVLTRFSLESDRNADGIEYAKVKLQRLGKLDEGQTRAVREYSGSLRGSLDTITVTETDVYETDDEGNPIL